MSNDSKELSSDINKFKEEYPVLWDLFQKKFQEYEDRIYEAKNNHDSQYNEFNETYPPNNY